jgi:hypothetical protein
LKSLDKKRRMKKSPIPTILYEENWIVTIKYYHPESDDYLDYKAMIRIKDSGKNPVEISLKFTGTLPCAAPMPPEEHVIKAASIIDLYSKLTKWFKKYGYDIR